ncbi:TPA: hypothetical protein TT573_000575 [Streptococcus equi subsp. zooepidemicus]|nr:hypothetical protein [Streptococcus equi subsp. zooepidemicus]HEL1145928.1 hypothetical protein [Streptococcus equi subsp. zooepidemicus]
MFNKKKKLQKSFNNINKHIDSLTLSEQEKRNLKGLLRNVKIRVGVA